MITKTFSVLINWYFKLYSKIIPFRDVSQLFDGDCTARRRWWVLFARGKNREGGIYIFPSYPGVKTPGYTDAAKIRRECASGAVPAFFMLC
ncbi:MAG: hypothetical protein FWE57_05340 [Chitinispirillia bacterium]|nr:hypothetical protein [Chitinispirillia bacterium]